MSNEWKSLNHVWFFATPRTVAHQTPPCPWNSSGQNTGGGCHFLLQGILPIRGSNTGFLHCRQILYRLCHQGGPLHHIISLHICCSLAQSCPTLQLHGLLHTRPPCPSPAPRVCSNSCSSSRWCHPTISSTVVPFSCPQSFWSPGSFPKSQLFASGDQSIRASASVLPMHTEGWFPLGLIGLISLLSEGFSRVFSSIIVWSIDSWALCLLYVSTLTSVHDFWENHSFDYMQLCQQSDVSTF